MSCSLGVYALVSHTLVEVGCGSYLCCVGRCRSLHSYAPCCSVLFRNSFHGRALFDTPSEVTTGTISGVGNGTTFLDHWAYGAGCEIAARERCM